MTKLVAQPLVRIFEIQGKPVADPNPQYTPEQVRKILSCIHPSIVNASLEGPTIQGSKKIYRFVQAVGTKG